LKVGKCGLLRAWVVGSTLGVGFIPRGIFALRTINHGTKWIPRFRNSSNTHQRHQRSKIICKKLRHVYGSTIKRKRRPSFTPPFSKTRTSGKLPAMTKREKRPPDDQLDR